MGMETARWSCRIRIRGALAEATRLIGRRNAARPEQSLESPLVEHGAHARLGTHSSIVAAVSRVTSVPPVNLDAC